MLGACIGSTVYSVSRIACSAIHTRSAFYASTTAMKVNRVYSASATGASATSWTPYVVPWCKVLARTMVTTLYSWPVVANMSTTAIARSNTTALTLYVATSVTPGACSLDLLPSW